jgi:hypothetical protein
MTVFGSEVLFGGYDTNRHDEDVAVSDWSKRLVGFLIAPMPIIDMLSSFNTSLFYVD